MSIFICPMCHKAYKWTFLWPFIVEKHCAECSDKVYEPPDEVTRKAVRRHQTRHPLYTKSPTEQARHEKGKMP